jgi:hypothetical protein
VRDGLREPARECVVERNLSIPKRTGQGENSSLAGLAGVAEKGAAALQLAVKAYSDAYLAARTDSLWPGVNLLALRRRAERDGITIAQCMWNMRRARSS